MDELRRRWLWVAVGGWLGGLPCYAFAAYNAAVLAGSAMSPGDVTAVQDRAAALGLVAASLGAALELIGFAASVLVAAWVVKADRNARSLILPLVLAMLTGACVVPPLLGLAALLA